MKKIIYLILFSLFLNVNLAHATVGWSKNIPATSENPQAISPDVIENNTALDLMLQDYRSGHVSISLISTSEIDVGPGGVMLSNSGGSTRLMVANSALTAVSSTMIDTGTISASSTYYLYAYASSTTATTFSVIFSASATSPTGITYYTRLGSFTTDSSKNFVSTSNDVYPQKGYGAYVSESANTPYTAATDGIVVAFCYGGLNPSASCSISVNSATIAEISTGSTTTQGCTTLTVPVAKGETWEVNEGGTQTCGQFINWKPSGGS